MISILLLSCLICKIYITKIGAKLLLFFEIRKCFVIFFQKNIVFFFETYRNLSKGVRKRVVEQMLATTKVTHL